MTIQEIAYSLNEKSTDYEIGELQSIRKEIKGLARRAGSSIFVEGSTITEDWACHYGGRKEMQFNIGKEDEGFRYGLAFSLEPSPSLTDPSILYPQIFKFNCLVRENPDFFRHYKMWYYQDGDRSDFFEVKEIWNNLITPRTFIFFGKIYEDDDINLDEVLQTFDDLLWVYKEVVTQTSETTLNKDEEPSTDFVFNKKNRHLPRATSYSTIEREIDVDIRHTYLQEILQKKLEEEFGKENVSKENPFNGNKIDLVVRNKKKYFFYEIKTASSAKSCVRLALGQLMEYAFGNCKRNASKIFVAGEFPIDAGTTSYLSFLRTEFKLPLEYKKIDILPDTN